MTNTFEKWKENIENYKERTASQLFRLIIYILEDWENERNEYKLKDKENN
jgi:hypothetical protein